MTTGPHRGVPYHVHPGHTPVPVDRIHTSVRGIPAQKQGSGMSDASLADLTRAVERLTLLTESFSQTPEQMAALRAAASQQRIPTGPQEETPKPFFQTKTGKAMKWAAGILVGGATAIFAFGATVNQFVGDNATKVDLSSAVQKAIEIHERDFGMISKTVGQNSKDISEVKTGVSTLVDQAAAENDVAEAQRILDAYQEEYDLDFAEYAAEKASGNRRIKRPKKRPEMIQAELDLESAQKRLESIQ